MTTSRVTAYAVELQWDEDGLTMTVRTDDGGGDVAVKVLDPENLWRAVQQQVGPWHDDMEQARRSFDRAGRRHAEHDDPGHAGHNLRADLHAMKEDA